MSSDAGPPPDFGPALTCALPAPPDVSCKALPTDYSPGADDMWEPCISDDGTYHRIQESISTIQRVRADSREKSLNAIQDRIFKLERSSSRSSNLTPPAKILRPPTVSRSGRVREQELTE